MNETNTKTPVVDSAIPTYVVKDTRPAPNRPMAPPDELRDIFEPADSEPAPAVAPTPAPPAPEPAPTLPVAPPTPPPPVPSEPAPVSSEPKPADPRAAGPTRDQQYEDDLADVADRLATVAAKLDSAAQHLSESESKLEQTVLSPAPMAVASAAASLPAAPESAKLLTLPNGTNQLEDRYKPTRGENRGMFGLFSVLALLVGIVLVADQKPVVWLALLGLNVVGTVGFNLMLRRLPWVHKDDWFTAAVLQTGMVVPFLVKEVVKPIEFPHYPVAALGILALAVTCLVSLQLCNVRALKNLEASVFSVVFNTRIIFATIFGSLVLGEAIPGMEILGGLLIFGAIFIVRQRGSKTLTAQGFAYGLGAALSMSILNTCEKELIKLVGYEQYIFPMFCMAAIVMWTIVVMKPGKLTVPVNLILKPQSLLLMALRASAAIGFSYSLVFGPVAVSTYVSSLSVVLLVIFGVLFLGERDYLKTKLAAAASALAGLTLILVERLGG